MRTIQVIPDDGEPYDVTPGSRMVMIWEQSGRNNTLARLNSNPSISDLYFLGYLAAVKAGKFSGSLDEFKNSVDLEFVPEPEDAGDPTQLGH